MGKGKKLGPSVAEALLRTITSEVERDLFSFLDANQCQQWIISADFCIDEESCCNDTCAVTLIPFTEPPEDISSRILKAFPRDLKNTRRVCADALDLLKDSGLFHFVFLLKGHRDAISTGGKEYKLDAHRNYIRAAVKILSDAGCPKEILRPFRGLLETSKAKTFNLKLMSDLILVSAILAAIVAMLITNNAQVVWLVPDRDNITTWCDGIYSDLIQNFVPGILALTDGEERSYQIKRAVSVASDGKHSWVDGFVRLPDYMAGAVAGWDVEKNSINSDKREVIFMHSIVDASNVAIFRLCFAPNLIIEKIVAVRK